MGSSITLFIALFLTAQSSGLALAHALQWAPKSKLGPEAFLQVQQTFYTAYGPVAGLLETGGLIASISALLLLDRSHPAHGWVGAALACLVMMLIVWAVLIQPINRQVAAWKPQALPQNWRAIGVHRWHALHLLRLTLASIALALLTVAAIRSQR